MKDAKYTIQCVGFLAYMIFFLTVDAFKVAWKRMEKKHPHRAGIIMSLAFMDGLFCLLFLILNPSLRWWTFSPNPGWVESLLFFAFFIVPALIFSWVVGRRIYFFLHAFFRTHLL